jgi:hypothetical protein
MKTVLIGAMAVAAAITFAPFVDAPIAHADKYEDQCRALASPSVSEQSIQDCINSVKNAEQQEEQDYQNCLREEAGYPGGAEKYCGKDPHGGWFN